MAVFSSPLGARVWIEGRERNYFSGTGYLGLQNHPRVQQAAIETIQRYGMATGTSRGGFGEHAVYDGLEEQARLFFGSEAVLYFTSGYLGALILAQGLRERYERIFVDAWSHFSVLDAARLAGKPLHIFQHLDAADLAAQIQAHLQSGERPLVLSDGVFPISGEIAPAPDYLPLVKQQGGLIALDDAHAYGVLGVHGRGTLDYWQIEDEDCLTSGTLSKALGGFGGVIPTSKRLLEELDRNSRIYTASSPVPLPVASAAACALEIARTEPELRERLWENVRLTREGLRAADWPVEDSQVPIICLRKQEGMDLEQIKNRLYEEGICIAHVRTYSSTPPGGALRIAIFATHTTEQIERLVESLSLTHEK